MIYSFGANKMGQCGQGHTQNTAIPHSVLTHNNITFTHIYAVADMSFALTTKTYNNQNHTTTNALYQWGYQNDFPDHKHSHRLSTPHPIQYFGGL